MRGVRLGLLFLLLAGPLALAQTAGAPEDPSRVSEDCRSKQGVKQIDGTAGPDTLTGTAGTVELVFGLAGDDSLTGAGPDDCLFGGPGDDALGANGEQEAMYGESGNDRLTGSDADDIADGGPGNDVIEMGGGTYDSGSGGLGGDVLRGGDGEDNLAGDAGRDELHGELGDDILGGELHDDAIRETEADLLRGGPGKDTLRGGRGDRLFGDAGNDRLFAGPASRADGGAGNDRIEIDDRVKVVRGGAGNDTILARDRVAERIDCGPGSDSVTADRSDRLVGCERVKLPPKPIVVNLTATPAAGGRDTVFMVSFTAPYTLDGTDGSSFDVEGRGASTACTSTQFSISARKGRRVSVRLDPPRRGWCRGTLRIRLLDVFSDPSSNCDSGDECAPSSTKVVAVRRLTIR